MAADKLEVINISAALAGLRTQIPDLSSTQNEAIYANLLYEPIYRMLITEGDFDFATKLNSLVAGSVVTPWAFAYLLPSDFISVRSLIPIAWYSDRFDPRPVEWAIYSPSSDRVLTNVACQQMFYTYRALESSWPGIFEHAFEQYLASALIYALTQHAEFSQTKVQDALRFAQEANVRNA